MDEILKVKENIVDLSAKNEALKKEMNILQQRVYSSEYTNRSLENSILEESRLYIESVDELKKRCMDELTIKF